MKKVIIVNDTTPECHHGCDVVMRGIYNMCSRYDISIVATLYVNMSYSESCNVLDKTEYDICLINGEGSIHHSQPRALSLARLIKKIKDDSKQVFVINATIQDNNEYILNALRLVDKIFVRESMSLNYLKVNYIDAVVVPDMSFHAEFNYHNNKRRFGFGVTDSVYDEVSIKFLNLSGNKVAFMPILRRPDLEIKNWLSLIRIVKYRLMVCFWRVVPLNRNRRFYVTKRIFYYASSYDEYIENVSKVNKAVISRFHTLCFAIKTRTPFVAVPSNTYKIQGLLEDVGISGSRVMQVANIDDGIFDSICEFNSAELTAIKKYVGEARGRIEDMFDTIFGR